MSMRKFSVLAIALITVYFTSAAQDFAYFNKYLQSVDSNAPDYETLLTNCFNVYGQLSANQKGTPGASHLGNVASQQSKMINAIEFLFKYMTLFKDEEKIYATVIVEAYNVVPYHNICHGLAVGLYAATSEISKVDTSKLDAKLITREVRSLFLAGLLHDIGHPGFTNNFFTTLLPKTQGIQLFKKNEIGKITTWQIDPINKGKLIPLDNILTSCTMIDVSQKTFFTKITQSVDTLHKNNANYAFDKALLKAIQFLEDGLDRFFNYPGKIYEPNQLNAIPQFKFMKGRPLNRYEGIDDHPVMKILCESAEIVHALIAYVIVENRTMYMDIDIDIIMASILATHMKLEFDSMLVAKSIFGYVHVSDLLGNISQVEQLRLENIEQLFFEFTNESMHQDVKFVGVDYKVCINPQDDVNAKQTAIDALASNGSRHKYQKDDSLCWDSFVSSQKDFIKLNIMPSLKILEIDKSSTFVDATDNYAKRANDIYTNMGVTEYDRAVKGLAASVKYNGDFFRII